MNPAAKNCTVTRIGRLWDAILVTDDGFGALMCQKCVQSQIRLGEWGGGGGSANREPGSYIYIYGGTCKSKLPLHSAFLKDMRELHSSFCSLKASMRSNGGKAFSEALRGCDLWRPFPELDNIEDDAVEAVFA